MSSVCLSTGIATSRRKMLLLGEKDHVYQISYKCECSMQVWTVPYAGRRGAARRGGSKSDFAGSSPHGAAPGPAQPPEAPSSLSWESLCIAYIFIHLNTRWTCDKNLLSQNTLSRQIPNNGFPGRRGSALYRNFLSSTVRHYSKQYCFPGASFGLGKFLPLKKYTETERAVSHNLITSTANYTR